MRQVVERENSEHFRDTDLMVELEIRVSVKRHVNQLRNRPVTEQSRGEVELEYHVPESNQVTFKQRQPFTTFK